MTTKRTFAHAALLAGIVFAGWPVSDAFLKIARQSGAPLGEILLICGLGSMITLALVAGARKKIHYLRPAKLPGAVILGLCQVIGFSCWMFALPVLPLANMYIVSFLSPMAVACLASFFLKERMGGRRAIAIGAGFCGVVVAVNPSNLFGDIDIGFSYLLLFGNMAMSSIQMFLLRLVADKERSESTAFSSRAVMAICGLTLCLVQGFHPISLKAFFALCASGALGGLGWNLLAEAYKHAPAAAVAPFQYTQIIWGGLIGYLIWNDTPSLYLIYGSAIIILSSVFLIRQERRISRTMPRID